MSLRPGWNISSTAGGELIDHTQTKREFYKFYDAFGNPTTGYSIDFSQSMALGIATAAVDHQLDDRLNPAERGFLYMPFEHSERLDDQQRSVLLFSGLGDDFLLGFAIKHRDIIARFGRFPHRNAMLGRTPRADEIAAGDVVPW